MTTTTTVDHQHAAFFCEPSVRQSLRNYYDIEQIDFSKAPFLSGRDVAAGVALPLLSSSSLLAAKQTSTAALNEPTKTKTPMPSSTAPATQHHRLFVRGSSSSENSLYSDGGESSPSPPIIITTIATQQQQKPQSHQQHSAELKQQQSQPPRYVAVASSPSRNNNGHQRCKNSVENLSEDSGYGEQQQQHFSSQLLRQRSRSIPNFTQHHDHYLIEEEPLSTSGDWIDDMMHKSLEHFQASMLDDRIDEEEDDDVVDGGPEQPATLSKSNHNNDAATTAAAAASTATPKIDDDAAASRRVGREERSSSSRTSPSPLICAHISASLPDILEHISAFGENGSAFDGGSAPIHYHKNHNNRNHRHSHHRYRRAAAQQQQQHFRLHSHRIDVFASPPVGRRHRSDLLDDQLDFSIVSSVPSCLNICISSTAPTGINSRSSSGVSFDVDDNDIDPFDKQLQSCNFSSATVSDHRNVWNLKRTSATATAAATNANSTAVATARSGFVVGVTKNTPTNRQRIAPALTQPQQQFTKKSQSHSKKLQKTTTTTAPTSVASQNWDLSNFETTTQLFGHHRSHESGAFVSGKQLKVINASYSNLTVLDYSGRRPNAAAATAISAFRAMAEQRKQQQLRLQQQQQQQQPSEPNPEQVLCKGNFLLDEISAHFDRNLSILNDRNEHDHDHHSGGGKLTERPLAAPFVAPPPPPVAPPRKQQPQQLRATSATSAASSASSSIIDLAPATYSYTFDRDPTNLVTAYTASLERCNFELNSSAQNVNQSQSDVAATDSAVAVHHQFQVVSPSVVVKSGKRHQLVSSTPNLCHTEISVKGRHHNNSNADDAPYLHTSSQHTSLNPLPSVTDGSGTAAIAATVGGQPVSAACKTVSVDGGLQGILAMGASRQSLGKGVSFCPVVSEISWKEQSSEEYAVENAEHPGTIDDR